MNNAASYKLLWIILSASVLVPKVALGPITLGMDDILSLLTIPYILYLFARRAFSGTYRINTVLVTCLSILVSGILFSMVSGKIYSGGIFFPTEMWQYVKRFVYFFWAIYMIQSGYVSAKFAIWSLAQVFICALIIGIIQTIPNPIGELLSTIYARNDLQLDALRDSGGGATSRNYSITGHSNSWGGFCLFIFSVFSSQLFEKGNRPGEGLVLARPVTLFLAFFAVINILLSGSRGSLLSLMIMLIVFLAMYFFSGTATIRARFLVRMMLAGMILSVMLAMFFRDRLEFISYRNEALMEEIDNPDSRAEHSRFIQVALGINALDGPYAWIFGIGNRAQREKVIEFGVEVEYVFMLVNYGIFGVFLRYYLLWLIFRRSIQLFKMRKKTGEGDAFAMRLGIMGILTLTGYLIFSISYFFYQEPVVGMTPWLLFGCIIGYPDSKTLKTNKLCAASAVS